MEELLRDDSRVKDVLRVRLKETITENTLVVDLEDRGLSEQGLEEVSKCYIMTKDGKLVNLTECW